MTEETKTVSYPYPERLHDDQGYPTQEALDYIKNWAFGPVVDGEFLFGQHYAQTDLTELIDYLKAIWHYNNAIVYEDGLLEIHTLGWSGNEEIIQVLQNTTLWAFKHQATQTGGHYYFCINRNSKYKYEVQKVESKW